MTRKAFEMQQVQGNSVEKVYLKALDRLKALADSVPNTPLLAAAKIRALLLLNVRYERLMIDRNLKSHPYPAVEQLVDEAAAHITAWNEVAFVEDHAAVTLVRQDRAMEENHHELFQSLWVKFSSVDYKRRIERYDHRLKINGLADGLLNGARCIDFGCGHGNFAHALLRAGAVYVRGVDYGESAISYAEAARDRLGVPVSRLEFSVESVYRLSSPDASFDFAIQNGVFHHLDDEDAAYREVARVLKPGGWFWVYTDGAGAISSDLWDASVHILRRIPTEYVVQILGSMGLETGKRYHLGDGLNAVYRHTTWEALTARLEKLGFGSFRRLKGGFPTDFDYDVIEADQYGLEKFGSGDLRLLAQKL